MDADEGYGKHYFEFNHWKYLWYSLELFTVLFIVHTFVNLGNKFLFIKGTEGQRKFTIQSSLLFLPFYLHEKVVEFYRLGDRVPFELQKKSVNQ